jgi:hypothetical protein
MGYEFESLQRSNGVEGILWPYLLSPRVAERTPQAGEMLPAATVEVVPEMLSGVSIDGQQLATAGLKRRGRPRRADQQVA